DLLYFDRDDFDSEGCGVAVDDGLDALVEAVAVCKELVEIDFTENRAQCGLGELGCLVDIVGDFDDSLSGIDDAECNDSVDLQRDIVTSDDVLRRDFHRFLPERNANHLVERAEDEDNTRTLGGRSAPEPEDDATFIL